MYPLTRLLISLVSKLYINVKKAIYSFYIFLKTHALVISIVIASTVTVGAVIYGGNVFLNEYKALKLLAREKFIWMKEKDRTDPFTDPIFIEYLKANMIENPLFQLTIQELFVLYSKKNSNILEVIPFIMPLWGDFDCFTKLALKIYLIRCIEKDQPFKALFCKTFTLYIKYIIYSRYDGADTNFSFSGFSESKIDINMCNMYIDNYSMLYSTNYEINSNIINSVSFSNKINLMINPTTINVPISIDSNGSIILNPNNPILELPIYMGTNFNISLNTKQLQVLEHVKLVAENHLINKDGLIILNIKQQTSYYNFMSEHVSYIIQIIYDIFS